MTLLKCDIVAIKSLETIYVLTDTTLIEDMPDKKFGLYTGWQMSANNFDAVLILHDGKLLPTNASFKEGKVKNNKIKNIARKLKRCISLKQMILEMVFLPAT